MLDSSEHRLGNDSQLTLAPCVATLSLLTPVSVTPKASANACVLCDARSMTAKWVNKVRRSQANAAKVECEANAC